MSDPAPFAPVLRLRLTLGTGRWLGPGKAELLALIAETGSIAAAGRRMGMSYKRAWSLVEALNAMFAGPLVHSSRGGAQGGGAGLTPLGAEVLDRWDRLHAAVAAAAADEAEALARLAHAAPSAPGDAAPAQPGPAQAPARSAPGPAPGR